MHGLQQLSFDRICAEIILREVISSKFTLEGFPKDFFLDRNQTSIRKLSLGIDFSKCKKSRNLKNVKRGNRLRNS